MIKTGLLLGVTAGAGAFSMLPVPKAVLLTVVSVFAYAALCVLLRAEHDNGRSRVRALTSR